MPTPAAKNFRTKRLTHSTYGTKPHKKPQSETSVQPSETSVQPSETSVQPSEKPRHVDVLKCLNQVIQEPVVHLEKQDLSLPVGTITIKPITGGK